jgi:two-component system response regulator HydG
LITGESGTGKELVARAIHAESRRASGPFVAVNCAAMPETLLESELFGHTKGSFTDAKTSREGLFVVANGGTLFLDEIGDMPLGMQVKLLRAIQERRVRPIGGSEEISFNTRIITATNRDIDSDVDEGRFRPDLFYRLNVVRVAVPPLRARGNDVIQLAHHFLSRSAEAQRRSVTGIAREAAEKMIAYPFPGNVRELENMIERAVALTSSSQIQLEDLPHAIRTYERPARVVEVESVKDLVSMEEVERRYVAHVLSTVAGNKTQAAHVLKMDRKTLYRKLQRWQQAAPKPATLVT